MHPQQEILNLIEQDTPKDQIIDMIMSGEVYDYGQAGDGRFVRISSFNGKQNKIYRSWDVLLTREGLTHDQFGHDTLHAHHPSGDKADDRNAVSISASKHISMHASVNMRQVWANYTPEKYETRCENCRKAQEGRFNGHEFLRTQKDPFTVREFWMDTDYPSYDSAASMLRVQFKAGNIEVVGKVAHGANVYQSLSALEV